LGANLRRRRCGQPELNDGDQSNYVGVHYNAVGCERNAGMLGTAGSLANRISKIKENTFTYAVMRD
jgi:hypothetical protein